MLFSPVEVIIVKENLCIHSFIIRPVDIIDVLCLLRCQDAAGHNDHLTCPQDLRYMLHVGIRFLISRTIIIKRMSAF